MVYKRHDLLEKSPGTTDPSVIIKKRLWGVDLINFSL